MVVACSCQCSLYHSTTTVCKTITIIINYQSTESLIEDLDCLCCFSLSEVCQACRHRNNLEIMWWHFDSSCVSPHCWILHSLVAVGDLMDLMRKLFHCIPSTRKGQSHMTWIDIISRRRNNQARKQLEANNVQPDWVPFGSDVDGECGKWQFIPTLKW